LRFRRFPLLLFARPAIPLCDVQSGAPSQQTRHARRLYVGGVGDAPEKEIEAFFAELVHTASVRPPQSNPILSVYLNTERKFAFVEFNSIELANTFVELDGLLFKGHPVKIRRPDDYNPSILPPEVRDLKEPVDYSKLPLSQPVGAGGRPGGAGGPGGGGGGPNPNRIYIGQIPPALTEVQLHELVSAFGAIRKLDVPKHPEGGPRGYAFVEYADPSVTDTAIAALDGLAVGDKKLSVSRAKVSQAGAPAGPGMPGGGGPAGFPPAMMAPGVGAGAGGYAPQAGYGGPPAGYAAPAPQAPAGGGRVVILDQMVTPDELVVESSYRDILEEIATECGRYGHLMDIKIPRPPEPGTGQVFLVYAEPSGAAAALQALVGRQFSGRFITGRLG
jgi:splicing factor U2AF subunit